MPRGRSGRFTLRRFEAPDASSISGPPWDDAPLDLLDIESTLVRPEAGGMDSKPLPPEVGRNIDLTDVLLSMWVNGTWLPSFVSPLHALCD
jgi:hypothetical protein